MSTRMTGAPAAQMTPLERLREFAAAVRRRWLAATLVLAFTMVGAGMLTRVQHKVYAATAQILLQPTDTVQSTISPGSISSQSDAGRDVATYTQEITVDPVAEAVRSQLGLPGTLSSLVGQIEVTGAETSNLVSITARDANAARAAQLASAFAKQYELYRREVALAQINRALAAAEANPQAKVATSAVAARARQLEAAAASETGGVQIVQPATVPGSPASPSLKKNLVLALVLGLILAFGSVLGLEAVDRRLAEPGQFAAAFGAPVLATIRGGRDRERATDTRRQVLADLAADLAFTGAAGDRRVLMLSPACPFSGAGSLALGLAEALVLVGRRVVLIEADLGPGGAPAGGEHVERGGLTSILTGRSSFAREVSDVHLVAGSIGDQRDLEPWARPSYSILVRGPSVTQPEVLLARPAMAGVFDEAKVRADVVLVLTAALERASGFLPLASICDGVILLASERSVTVERAQRIVNLLGGVGTPLLGTVLVPGGRRERPSGAAQGLATLVPHAMPDSTNGSLGHVYRRASFERT